MYIFILLLVGIVVLLCVFVGRLSEKLKIPSLVLFIGIGLLFGEDGIGGIVFDDYGFVETACSICLIFVIFYGGFGTNFKMARPVLGQAAVLSFAGTALTAGLLGAAVYLLINTVFGVSIGWLESMLIGSVIASTDAASVFNILRSRRLNLKYNTASLLEMESGSNDPMSYMLTMLFVSLLSVPGYGAGEAVSLLVCQICFGGLIGVALGFAAIFVLKKLPMSVGQGGTIFLLAVALLAYVLPQIPSLASGIAAINGNGYLAVYIAGIMIGNSGISKKREISKFCDNLTSIAQMMIFFLLGLLATPSQLPSVILPALLIFAVLTVIVRPIVVTGLLLPFRVNFGKILVVSWAGLRGVASVVFAIVATGALDADALPYNLFNLVFCIVLMSVIVQGTLLPVVSRRAGMIDTEGTVMRTFNDYEEQEDIGFIRIEVGEDHPWYNKMLRETVMPKEFLILLVLRNNEAIVPSGDTRIQRGDVLVAAAPEFTGKDEFGMYEEHIGKKHKWKGKHLYELDLPSGTLVAMIRRNGTALVPRGSTLVEEEDTLAILRIKDVAKEEKT